jgi:hypothetical protein
VAWAGASSSMMSAGASPSAKTSSPA